MADNKTFTSSGYKSGRFEMHWGVRVDLDKPTTGVVSNGAPEWLHEAIHDGIDLAWEEHVAECRGVCNDCHCNHSGPLKNGTKCQCYGKPKHKYDPRDDHDGCGPEESGTVLAGKGWKRVEGPGHKNFDKGAWDERMFEVGRGAKMYGYAVDRTSGNEFAAIVGEIYTQVVWSETVVRVRSLCSPCYPGQADVERDKLIVTGSECRCGTVLEVTDGGEIVSHTDPKGERCDLDIGYLAYDLPKDMYGDEE